MSSRANTLSIVLLSACAFGCGAASGKSDDGLLNPEGGGGGTPSGAGGGGPGSIATDGGTGAGEGTPNKVGVGTATPFDPKGGGSGGVKVDPKGRIVIDTSSYGTSSAPIIWVANSQEGTISKIDTRTMKELARYRTGPGNPDPSRTTVGLNGDVVVANRGGASATKISSNPVDCIGPGGGTSTGPGDVRAWGDDKCVRWNTPFPPGSLARAATFDAETGLDGELSTSVWIGLYGLQQMVQLDSKTGKKIAEVNVAPIRPYGAAIDKDHNVWVWGGGVGKVFGPTKKWEQIASPPCAYGIAVDEKGRVWTSGGNCVARYTPAAAKWESMSAGSSNRGLALDAKGSVWVADTPFGVHQVDQEKMTLVRDIRLGGGANDFVGMAVDFDGKVWAINEASSDATKIDPKTYATSTVKVGSHPYTYSDMTGFQLRNAAAPFGVYKHVFKGCGINNRWTRIEWAAELLPGTSLKVRARTGKTLDALKAATWALVATVPSDKSPVDIAAILGPSAKADFLEVEFTLRSTTASVTPILSSIGAFSGCGPAIN